MKLGVLLIIPVFALALAGCEPEAQQGVQKHGSRALEEAGKAGQIAMQSLLKQAQKLDTNANPELRKKTQKAIDDMRAQMEKIPNPSPEVQKQLDGLRAAGERLDAQQMVSDARAQMEALVKQAQKTGESIEDTRKKLEDADRQYQELKKKATDAQKRADDATKDIDNLGMM